MVQHSRCRPWALTMDVDEEAYLGEFDSLEDYAREYIESTGMLHDVPETIANYFDYESFGRDLQLGGDVWTAESPDNRLFVFNNH
jgi:antirestriction protein